ncbi:MAG TPA: imidazole glycerol phosphate synthase subunit HisF [Thermoanaerobaculia bacterium]|nr:imidazole glycerol phosphate synthase subunit HisF [Thermoanaerobaculia bacterium]
MQLIPSLDLLDGRVVRLTHGDFASARDYGEPEAVLDALDVPRGTRLHVVDLEASRSGRPIETGIVERLAKRDLVVQVGGGIRSLDDARRWLDCGAERLVVGTVAATSPQLLAELVETFGTHRIVPAVDVRDGVIRTDGWERSSSASLRDVFARIETLGVGEALVTDISKDGALRGPSFALYRELRALTRVRIIASGGVSTASDVVSLARLGNVSGCVIGKALLERRIDLADALARVITPNAIPERIIPCLDVRDGRVVKGVAFTNIRDAGDPVECAMRYEAEGADELVILDISATDRASASDRASTTSLDTVRRVADSIFIPLTVGGGVRSVDDFRALLRAGADRVAVNTAALRRPALIEECATEFGVQAVVLSCDAANGFATVRSGKEQTTVDAVQWCAEGERRGAGEILLTSVDRDGTNRGFDVELLRAVTAVLKIGVIASGGAGTLEHFRDAVESGGARAVLAASLFHDRVLSVGDVKRYLSAEGIPVR